MFSQKNLCVLRIGDNVQQVLAEHVEGVWVVEGEDEDGRLGVLVVAGRDGGHALHAASVPKLQLQGALAKLVDLAVVVKAWSYVIDMIVIG